MSFANNTPIQYIPGIGWRTAKVMHELGIHTAGQLQHMPESVLIELFGPSIRSVLHTITPEESVYDNDFSSHTKIDADQMKKWSAAIGDEKLSWLTRFKLAAQFVSHLQ